MRRAALLWALLILVLVAARPVGAHEGGEALIIVPADHILPGEPFPLIAADFDPNTAVEISILRDGEATLLDTVTAQADGHFEAELWLPADYPHGYAELIGFSEFGIRAATWVLVGPRAEGPGQAGAPPTASPPIWSDPSVLLLGLLVVGGVLGLAYLLLRPAARRRANAPASARAGIPRTRPGRSRSKPDARRG